LLVPYFSWKYSHAAHHVATNDLKRDTVFVPHTRSNVIKQNADMLEESPLVNLLLLVRMLLLGWPAYLFVNAASHQYDEWASHFKPTSPFFKKSQYWGVVTSNVGLIAALALYTYATYHFGIVNFLNYFFLPYLWTNFWLVMYTFLQHTDKTIPHFDSDEWTFLRGALCTIDRPYGIFDWFHHKIGSTHVCHHLFSKIPHYHALEATQHIKKVIGEYYNITDESPITSLWKEFTYCKFIEDSGPARFFTNFNINQK